MRTVHKSGCTEPYVEGQLRLLRIDKAVELPTTLTGAAPCQLNATAFPISNGTDPGGFDASV